MYALTMLTLLAATGASASAESLRAGVAAAESLFQQARYEEAGERFCVLYETMNGERAAHGFVALRYAQCLAHQQQWYAARDVVRKSLEDQRGAGQRARLNYVLGRCQSALSEHTAAREAYFEVVRSPQAAEPLKLRALWMIAHGYAAQDELRTAREAFLRLERRAETMSPLAAGAIIEAGRCSERLADWEAAEEMYKQAVIKYADAGIANEASRRLAVVEARRERTQR